MTTLELLLQRYSPLLTLEQLGEVLSMSPGSLRNAISAGEFHIPTSRIGKRRYADVRDVAAFLDAQRTKALQERSAEQVQSSVSSDWAAFV